MAIDYKAMFDYQIKRRFECLETMAIALNALEASHDKLLSELVTYPYSLLCGQTTAAISELKKQIGC